MTFKNGKEGKLYKEGQNIHFDIAVNYEYMNESKKNVGITINVLKADLSKNNTIIENTSNRISFDIPLHFHATKNKK